MLELSFAVQDRLSYEQALQNQRDAVPNVFTASAGPVSDLIRAQMPDVLAAAGKPGSLINIRLSMPPVQDSAKDNVLPESTSKV